VNWTFPITPLLLVAGVLMPDAQTAPPPKPASPAPAPAATPVSAPERFTVQSDGHPLAVWGRRPAGTAPVRGAILLVHGRTWSSRPDFDLQVPGMQRSVMMSFVSQGYAAYAVDLRGYGETPRDATGWMTPLRAAQDVSNVLAWIAPRHAGLPLPALVGWSRGAAIAQLAAQNWPSRLSTLVLFGFAFDPDLQFVDLPAPGKPLMMKNTADAAQSDFISPKITPPAVVTAFTEQALKADPVLVDLKGDAEFNLLKPAKVMTPTLIMFGERDPGVAAEDAGKYFARFGTGDKQMVVLPGADHAAQLEDTHDAWIMAIVNFLNRPGLKK
jgi:pimeloyl-ACP methyl ester carboxylesterase